MEVSERKEEKTGLDEEREKSAPMLASVYVLELLIKAIEEEEASSREDEGTLCFGRKGRRGLWEAASSRTGKGG